MIKNNVALTEEIRALQSKIADLERVDAERGKLAKEMAELTHDLDERVRELNCLHSLTLLIENPGVTLEGIFEGAINLIPPAWQYPEVACARIIFEGREFKTYNFKDTNWKQSAGIGVYREEAGRVEVCYLKEKPPAYEGPFLKEERDLLETIAERLGKIIERHKDAAALKESEKRYKDLADSLPQTIFEFDKNQRVVFVNKAGFGIFGYTQEDLEKGVSAAQVIVPEDRERMQKNILRILSGEDIGGIEYTALKKDGARFPVIVYACLIIRDNKPWGLRGIIIEAAGRAKA